MRTINDQQKNLYEKYDTEGSQRYLNFYAEFLEKFSERKELKILDIGGGSGNFAFLLKKHFAETAEVTVYVLDTMEYDTWAANALGGELHFVHDSVENIAKLFEENTFDLVFANRVFHHFVDKTYKKTLDGMSNYLAQICKVLKPDGLLCIMDHFYKGLITDGSASRMIYMYTSVKNPLFASFVKKLGAMTAGVGVCFQSERMWLERVKHSGFEIEHVKYAEHNKLSLVKKLGLLCRWMSRNNLILARPKK